MTNSTGKDQSQDVRIERLETDLINLTRLTERTAANVEGLTRQVSSLFGRANKPIEWSAIIAGVGLLIVGAGLLIAPIKEDLRDQKAFNQRVQDHLQQDADVMGEVRMDLEWLKSMEERIHGRLDK